MNFDQSCEEGRYETALEIILKDGREIRELKAENKRLRKRLEAAEEKLADLSHCDEMD